MQRQVHINVKVVEMVEVKNEDAHINNTHVEGKEDAKPLEVKNEINENNNINLQNKISAK